MKLDALLTDGHYKHTYAILRALVAKGLKIGILFHNKLSLSYYSRFVAKRFIVNSDIYQEEYIYKNEIIRILKNYQIDVLLPIGNISNNLVSKYKDIFSKYAKIPVANYDIMRIAQYKNETFKFAKKIGISIPETIALKHSDDIEKVANRVDYPCVIKKVSPQETGVVYCNDKDELRDQLRKMVETKSNGFEYPMIQEYVEGKGTGFYALYNRGKCIAYFMHERIHEYPITGGASTLAKSTYEDKLKKTGEKVLSELKWHGVAMVEFKKDLNENYKLMEINPKFWGSLELSYKAGINFPYLVYLSALGKEVPITSYENDIYFRWTFPHDVLWKRFASTKDKRDFKILRRNNKIHSNIHFDDPLTVLYNLMFTVFKLLKEKKYPHGKITEQKDSISCSY